MLTTQWATSDATSDAYSEALLVDLCANVPVLEQMNARAPQHLSGSSSLGQVLHQSCLSPLVKLKVSWDRFCIRAACA